MVCQEYNFPKKLEMARQVYDFVKTQKLEDLIEGKEVSYKEINSENPSNVSSDAIATYSFQTTARGKPEEIIIGRTYFSDDIDGNQTFYFVSEGFPPILKDNVRKFLRSEFFPLIKLESSIYVSPEKQKPRVHPSRTSSKNLSADLVFKNRYYTGNPKNIGNV